jgi:hypothetical protein
MYVSYESRNGKLRSAGAADVSKRCIGVAVAINTHKRKSKEKKKEKKKMPQKQRGM